MNSQVKQFYQEVLKKDQNGLFVDVIPLEMEDVISYEEAKAKAPDLPKGWFELSQLNVEDRIQFTRDYWINTLPFVPNFHSFLIKFFDNLDDVGVYLTQIRKKESFHCEMVYSLKEDRGFYRGGVFNSKERIEAINASFDRQLPEDYLQFLKIHNGFTKTNDLGIIRSENLKFACEKFYEMLEQDDHFITCSGKPINPKHLVPFYHCLGLQSFQCFFTDWYPSGHMGNVYFSGIDHCISNYQNKEAWMEQMAFPSFLDWLKFYMEEIELEY